MQISCDTINFDIFPFNCLESVLPHFITMLIGFLDFVIQLFDYQWITKIDVQRNYICVVLWRKCKRQTKLITMFMYVKCRDNNSLW